MKRRAVPVKKTTTLLLAFLLITCVIPLDRSFAQPRQTVEIPSSPNPVGSGARALGMGGAFIAVADDATAASWNPGGLIQLELPEVSMVGAAFYRTEDNVFGNNPEASGDQSVDEIDINYLSAAYPFRAFGHNMIVSVNYQHLYDFSREGDFFLTMDQADLFTSRNVDYEQEGTLSALGIASCVQITPNLSFGLTVNIWEDDLSPNEWEKRTLNSGWGSDGGDPFTFEYRAFDRYTFSGVNANLGLLWRLNDKLTMGAVLKTPFEADLKHKWTVSSSTHYPDQPEEDPENGTSFFVADETLDMPLSFGIGFAYRFSDAFTVSADVHRTEWDDFVLTDSEGNETSFISGRSTSESDIDPTYQVRVGAEYLFITPQYTIPLRGGFFYDPAPAEGSPDDFFGFSLGSGIAVGRFVFDIAYRYRFGNDVGTHYLEALDFSQDVDEHTVYASLIVHF